MLSGLTTRGKIYLLIAAASFAFAYLITAFNFFPQAGIALSFSIFATLVFFLKKRKENDTKTYFILVLLFSLGLLIRSEPSVSLLNLFAVMFFGLLMLVPDLSEKSSLIQYGFSTLAFMIRSLTAGKGDYYLEYKNNKKDVGRNKIIRTVFGILVTVILLAVVLPLLSAANPLFQNIVKEVSLVINLENLFKQIGTENIVIWVIRLIVFFVFIFLIPKILTLINKESPSSFPQKIANIPLSIPKFILAGVLLIFFITQLQLYFASDATLIALGLNHSLRTREVFTQLSVVAGIILLLIYNSREKDKQTRILNWILGISGIFLSLMAYKSVFEYIGAWGLTTKRLFGLTFATWILGIFILFFKNYLGQNQNAWFIRKTFIYSGVILVLVNIFNFDYLIYHFNKARTGQGTDYNYLLKLSADSLSFKEQYTLLENVSSQNNPEETYNNITSIVFLNKIRHLQKKYNKFDFRAFNLLDYFQYKEVQSIDTEKLMQYYSAKLAPKDK